MKQNNEIYYVIRKKGTELFLDRENKLDTIQYAHLYDLDVALEEYDLLPYPEKFSITQVEIYYFNDESVEKKHRAGDGDEYSKRIGFLEAYFQATCGLSKTQAKKYLQKITEDKK